MRSVCFAQNFGVRRPGAALACFSLDSFANQAVLLRSDFPSGDRGVRWAKARAGSIAREPYASPKTLECGGSAPLWPVSPWTHLRINLSCCEAISRPVDRGKVGQSASGLDRTRTVCFAQNFGVWRPGAALACFSLDSFANQAVLLRSDFPSGDRGVRWAKARAGSIAREPYASPKTLECGGSAPLWPVSPWTHLRIKLSCCEAISRPVDRGKVGQSASGLDRTRTVCFAQNFGVRRPGAALACFSLDSFANQAVLLRSDFPFGCPRRKVGQSASGLDRTRTVCFAQNFGVRRPGAALACFSLDSFANQAVLLRSDFPSG